MTTQLEQIRDQQQATWDKFSAGWKKWDELVRDWLAPVGMELLDSARLRPDSYVLDIASGTGEPALSAASPPARQGHDDRPRRKDAPRRQGERRASWSPQCRNAPVRRRCSSLRRQHVRRGHGPLRLHVLPRRLDGSPRARPCGQTRRPDLHRRVGPPEKNPWATTIMGTVAKHVDCPRRRPARRACSVAPRPATWPGSFAMPA